MDLQVSSLSRKVTLILGLVVSLMMFSKFTVGTDR